MDELDCLSKIAVLADKCVSKFPELEWIIISPSRRILIFISKDSPESKAQLEFISELDGFLGAIFKDLVSKVSEGKSLTRESISEIIENNIDLIPVGFLTRILESASK